MRSYRLPAMLLALALPALAVAADPPARGKSVGVNVAITPSYFSTSYAFADAMKMAKEWTIDGWETPCPTRPSDGALLLPTGKEALTTFFFRSYAGQAQDYPVGEYTVLFEGSGDFRWGATTATDAPGRFTYTVPFRNGDGTGEVILCTRSDPADPVRNIRVMLPGYGDGQAAFRKEFVDNLGGYSVLRSMQDTGTNNEGMSPKWADRCVASEPRWNRGGVPWELIVDLSNKVGSDAWICINAQADDDYITQLARLVHARLDPKLRAYVEFSNEVWNWEYAVAQQQIGKETPKSDPAFAGMTDDQWKMLTNFYGQTDWLPRRSRRAFDLWEAEWSGADRARLVTVIASQSVWPERSRFLLASARRINGGRKPCDALAVAPYFYPSPDLCTDEWNQRLKDPATTLDALFASATQVVGPGGTIDKECRANRAVADEFGVAMLAYEGGQHYKSDDQASNNLYLQFNRDPRMESLYATYLDTLFSAGFKTICLYAQMGTFAPGQTWGLQESGEAPIDKSYKLKGVRGYMASATAPVIPPGGDAPPVPVDPVVVVVPDPPKPDPGAKATGYALIVPPEPVAGRKSLIVVALTGPGTALDAPLVVEVQSSSGIVGEARIDPGMAFAPIEWTPANPGTSGLGSGHAGGNDAIEDPPARDVVVLDRLTPDEASRLAAIDSLAAIVAGLVKAGGGAAPALPPQPGPRPMMSAPMNPKRGTPNRKAQGPMKKAG